MSLRTPAPGTQSPGLRRAGGPSGTGSSGTGSSGRGAPLPVSVPSRTDGLIRRMSEMVGGPMGRHTVPGRTGGSFLTPMRVLILLTTLSAVVAVLLKSPCRVNGWSQPTVYYAGCYSDWSALYGGRGFAEDPFAPFAAGASFEYPVLMSVVASIAAVIARTLPFSELNPSLAYWDVNFVLTAILWIVTVVVTAKSAGRRPWDALMVAVAPGIILAGSVNWDLWAVALMALGLWLFGGRRPLLAGMLFGLGAAMKLYPVLILGVLLILAVRSLKWAPLAWAALGTVAAWFAVNLPMMLGNFDAWSVFFTFSGERGPGLSSIWHAWDVTMEKTGGPTVDPASLSLLAYGAFFVCCAGIFLLGVTCRYRPRVAQLAFLVVGAFVLCNKVYSPQFVIWLIPLAALAVPRWRDYLIWQFVEVLHFWAIWMYLAKDASGSEVQHSLDDTFYVLAVLAHMAATLYLMARVVEQMLSPAEDPVRASLPGGRIWLNGNSGTGQITAAARLERLGFDPSEARKLPVDDPLGGDYDDAPDRAPWLVRPVR
ncbi:glycosyltransferase family 87 protein [Citricoccus sp. GCM10030269]|uniref:glycosyltransferase family 87 protein n=1 Tax=Citricoccus sp. GCM10030269 TaxID=3273388 RepID=UPI00361B4F17